MKRRRIPVLMDSVLLPFINVIFLLMVALVLIGRVESHSGPNALKVPHSKIGQPASGSPAVLTLYKDGRIELDGKHVQREGLYAGLKLIFVADKENPITIRADAGLPAEYLMSALALIKRAGGRNITLITEQ